MRFFPSRPVLLGSYEGYRLVRHRGSFYGVPTPTDPEDLNLEEDCHHAGVISGESCEEVQERIHSVRDAVPIEYAGWLPIFERSGNCGRHPQFKHTVHPPSGYRFTCSARRKHRPSLWDKSIGQLFYGLSWMVRGFHPLLRPFFELFRGGRGVAPLARLRVLAAIVRLFFTLRRNGARLFPILLFLRTRHYQSQLLLAHYRGPVFLPSMPFTYGQNPWVIEIEDPTTLFYPLIHNGQTRKLRISKSRYFPIIKTLLESNQCKAIITHMKSTAGMVSTLFGSETIRKKVFHTPLGVKLPARWQRHDDDESEPLNLLFTNSWHQMPVNFHVRGGIDVLEAFAVLHKRYPRLRLTMRTHLPGLRNRHYRIIEEGWVRVINRFLSPQEMDDLLASSHIFLLPAARVHVVSLLQAMSYGLAVVTSDGWGIDEYVTHERNGVVVNGRYGKVSWVDEKEGMLREYYDPMHRPDPKVVSGLVEAVSRLVEDRSLRKRLGQTARLDVETTYSVERWNSGLKEIFDKVLSRDQCP